MASYHVRRKMKRKLTGFLTADKNMTLHLHCNLDVLTRLQTITVFLILFRRKENCVTLVLIKTKHSSVKDRASDDVFPRSLGQGQGKMVITYYVCKCLTQKYIHTKYELCTLNRSKVMGKVKVSRQQQGQNHGQPECTMLQSRAVILKPWKQLGSFTEVCTANM